MCLCVLGVFKGSCAGALSPPGSKCVMLFCVTASWSTVHSWCKPRRHTVSNSSALLRLRNRYCWYYIKSSEPLNPWAGLTAHIQQNGNAIKKRRWKTRSPLFYINFFNTFQINGEWLPAYAMTIRSVAIVRSAFYPSLWLNMQQPAIY